MAGHRWTRISLRTFLVMVILLGSVVGWLGIRARRIRDRHNAVKTVKELGGSVRHATEANSSARDPFGTPPANAKTAPGGPLPVPQWLQEALGTDGFDDVLTVNLSRRKISDEDLVHLQRFPRLQGLCLGQTAIGDAGLKHLEGLGELEDLALYRTRITDQGLTHLENLSKLKQLTLNTTDVTDNGLRHLTGLRELKVLDLAATQVKGPGLKHLRALPNLEGLDLGGNEICDEGWKYVSQLPNLEGLVVEMNHINDTAVLQFQQMKKLRDLIVFGLSGEELEELNEMLPNVKVRGI